MFALAPEDNEVAINCGMDIDDARYARARENLERVDVLGLTEAYDDFVAHVRDRFGWWPGGVDLTQRENVSTEDWDVTMCSVGAGYDPHAVSAASEAASSTYFIGILWPPR